MRRENSREGSQIDHVVGAGIDLKQGATQVEAAGRSQLNVQYGQPYRISSAVIPPER